MVILRPTQKLQAALPTSVVSAQSDTALGDWYVNRIVVHRQPLLLLVSSCSLLPIVVPAREVRSLPRRLPALVASRLRRLGIGSSLIDAEVAAMHPVVVAPTVDRSVLGIVVDFAKAIPYYAISTDRGAPGLAGLEDWLAETPCHAARAEGKVVFPNRIAPELLVAKWLADHPLQPTRGARVVVH